MLDLDKIVGNRVCSNTRGYEDIVLKKEDDNAEPYFFNLRTGCKNEPEKGERFCENCTKRFSFKDGHTGKVLFLESIHPLGNKSNSRVCNKLIDCNKIPGEEWILVKLFGVRYKH